MWFQIKKKIKKKKKNIQGKRIPKQQTKHKGGIFQMYYSVFKPVLHFMEGSAPRWNLVDSIPGDGGAQAHQGRASQVGWQSWGSQQWPLWHFGGVEDAAKLKKSLSTILTPSSEIHWNDKYVKMYLPHFSQHGQETMCVILQKKGDYFLNKMYFFFIISAPWTFFLQQ